MIELGTIVAGKYLLDRVIGHGGMGVVVQATHLQLHQPVAIKFLLPDALNDAEIQQRFMREARAAVQLRSEHVAHVLDVGALETGLPYMVLEYLEGTDLASFPRAQLSIGGLIDLMLQACEALAEAHALGIVHRDIKPANLFVTRSPGGAPLLKLLDFGISKAAGTTGKLTRSQVVLGTPEYMSPEQMRASRKADHRSDIWSLGVVVYELVEGAPPFNSHALSEAVIKVVNDPVPRLTARLPAGLDDIIYRCLEKDPADRFQTAAELAAALAGFAASPAQAAITLQRTRGLCCPAPQVAVPADAVPNRGPPTTLSEASMALNSAAVQRRRWTRVVALGIASAAALSLLTLRSSTTAGPAHGSDSTPSLPAAAPEVATQPVNVAPGPSPGPSPVRRAPDAVEPPAPAVVAPAPTRERIGPAVAPPRRPRPPQRHSRPPHMKDAHDKAGIPRLPPGLDRGD